MLLHTQTNYYKRKYTAQKSYPYFQYVLQYNPLLEELGRLHMFSKEHPCSSFNLLTAGHFNTRAIFFTSAQASTHVSNLGKANVQVSNSLDMNETLIHLQFHLNASYLSMLLHWGQSIEQVEKLYQKALYIVKLYEYVIDLIFYNCLKLSMCILYH